MFRHEDFLGKRSGGGFGEPMAGPRHEGRIPQHEHGLGDFQGRSQAHLSHNGESKGECKI